MAYGDYAHCTRCDAKAFYDAEVDYDYGGFGAMWVLCKDCRAALGDDVLGAVSAILTGGIEVQVIHEEADGDE